MLIGTDLLHRSGPRGHYAVLVNEIADDANQNENNQYAQAAPPVESTVRGVSLGIETGIANKKTPVMRCELL